MIIFKFRPLGCVLRNLLLILLPYHNKLEWLSLSFTSTLICYLQTRNMPTRVELLALPKSIRLGWRWMALANTLAYYNTTIITASSVMKNVSAWHKRRQLLTHQKSLITFVPGSVAVRWWWPTWSSCSTTSSRRPFGRFCRRLRCPPSSREAEVENS